MPRHERVPTFNDNIGCQFFNKGTTFLENKVFLKYQIKKCALKMILFNEKKISVPRYVDFWSKIYLILHPSFGNLTTHIHTQHERTFYVPVIIT